MEGAGNFGPIGGNVRQGPLNNNRVVFNGMFFVERPARRIIFYNRAQKNRAVNLRRQGLTYRQIARRIGPFCSCGTVFQWVRRAQAREERNRRLQNA